jgi:hypothetical protein
MYLQANHRSWHFLVVVFCASLVGACESPRTTRQRLALERDTFKASAAQPSGIVHGDEFDETDDVTGPPLRTIAAHPAMHRITLQDWFLEEYADRATLTSQFDPVAMTVHRIRSDADAHISGTIDEVKLTMVAELMNARLEQNGALQTVSQSINDDSQIQLTGVWRLWCEHPGTMDHIQDAPIPDYGTFRHLTNPDHVFEIHPVTGIEGTDVMHTVKPMPSGYRTKDAKTAFERYESLRCRIEGDWDLGTTTIHTTTIGYNYPEFVLEPLLPAQELADGYAVLGYVWTKDGSERILDQPRRMIFVEGSQAADALGDLDSGETMHVLGMPRIDLGVVWVRVISETNLEANLPYEIVIVGVYD